MNGSRLQSLDIGPVTAVVPVKPLEVAKSRLSMPDSQRRELALAFAVDTIAALRACPHVAAVIAVTDAASVAPLADRLAVPVVPDDGSGLNGAVAAGVALADALHPGHGVLVVPADLPCLRAVDVTLVLAGVAGLRGVTGAFVPDRAGIGTTMLAHSTGRPVITRYGPGSAVQHTRLGMRALHEAPVRARHDVDTLEDLWRARSLGLGTATSAVLAQFDVADVAVSMG